MNSWIEWIVANWLGQWFVARADYEKLQSNYEVLQLKHWRMIAMNTPVRSRQAAFRNMVENMFMSEYNKAMGDTSVRAHPAASGFARGWTNR